MKKTQPWIKGFTLVFFFGAMISFVAYRAGAFNQSAQNLQRAPEAYVPDSPRVEPNIIYSTKSGRIIETRTDTHRKNTIMSSSKSIILNEPVEAAPRPDSIKKADSVKQMKKETVKPVPNNSNSNNKSNNSVMPSSKSGPMFTPSQVE